MNENRTLGTSRMLPFAVGEIYGAFANAEQLALWWGPLGFSNTFEIFEFTTGGRWKFVMHGPDGRHYVNESIFTELVPELKIVIEHVCPPHFELTVTLEAANEGTQLSWQQVFDDAATVQAIQQIVGPANEQNIDRLSALLATKSLKTDQSATPDFTDGAG